MRVSHAILEKSATVQVFQIINNTEVSVSEVFAATTLNAAIMNNPMMGDA